MFDLLTISKLKYYVYALADPESEEVFYVGKGHGNRVFDHVIEVMDNPDEVNSLKKSSIAKIIKSGRQPKQWILRHGMTESESLLVESVLIGFHNRFISPLTNEVAGHGSEFYGFKSCDDLIRQYNAQPLDELKHEVVIININKKYLSNTSAYEATKEAWVISESRLSELEYALAEYQGVIVGVYSIQEWYPVKTSNNKRNSRWGFNGVEAPDAVQQLYLNKSIAHHKVRGAANPIRYNL